MFLQVVLWSIGVVGTSAVVVGVLSRYLARRRAKPILNPRIQRAINKRISRMRSPNGGKEDGFHFIEKLCLRKAWFGLCKLAFGRKQSYAQLSRGKMCWATHYIKCFHDYLLWLVYGNQNSVLIWYYILILMIARNGFSCKQWRAQQSFRVQWATFTCVGLYWFGRWRCIAAFAATTRRNGYVHCTYLFVY